MITFEEHIVHNKRASAVLIILFIIFVAGLGFVFGYAVGGTGEAGIFGIVVAFVFALIYSAIAFWGGKSIIMGVSGARKVDKRFNQQLYNIVEEMAIAGGMPVPEIYIIDDSAPNAFATGRDPQHSAVAVTVGLLDKLNREELTGVIAHEMSHIRNYDIRFMLLIGVLVGVVALASDFMLRYAFRGGFFRRRGRGGSGGAQMVVILLAIALAIIAPVFALILQFAVSRKREYLADASSVQFTRNPEGLARALEKIAGDPERLEAANRATQHLYIVNPMMAQSQYERSSIFSTHPPIMERVRRLRAM